MAPGDKNVVIGLVGGGTVGGGVYDICMYTHANFFSSIGANVTIKTIAVRSLNKPRDFQIDSQKTSIVDDYNVILNDPEINTVVEVMGGTTIAKDVVMGALKRGKHVITANKALVATYLDEINALAQSVASNGTQFAYEAAVCGGIPIIHTLQHDYLGDQISQVMGIMNGTTNFMLTKMESGADYCEVLAEAQALGYAEADPTADVEGHDVQAKIAILTKLAFGVTVPLECIPCKGISSITSTDFEYAKLLGCTIKLLGMAQLSPDNDKINVMVSPYMIPSKHTIASVSGSTNVVSITSKNLFSSSYVGPGAGRYPTANSVVNDIVRLARGMTAPAFTFNRNMDIATDYFSKFYIRINIRDQVGVIKSVGEIAEKHDVGIHAVLQTPIENPDDVDFVVTTEMTRLEQVQAMVTDIGKQQFCLKDPVFFGCL